MLVRGNMQIDTNLGIGSVIQKMGSVEKANGGEDFSDILNETISNVVETEKENEVGNLELLAGEDVSIHETMIQAEKAELALELALQVRNKVIDAYNEVMRMQL